MSWRAAGRAVRGRGSYASFIRPLLEGMKSYVPLKWALVRRLGGRHSVVFIVFVYRGINKDFFLYARVLVLLSNSSRGTLTVAKFSL